MCIISALEENATALNAFMYSRISKVISLRENMRSKTWLKDVYHVASVGKIANICTRRETSLLDKTLRYKWQTSPSWRRLPCHQWPCYWDFTATNLPDKENMPIRVVLAVQSTSKVDRPYFVKFIMDKYWTYTEVLIKLAKNISDTKRLRKVFAPMQECI